MLKMQVKSDNVIDWSFKISVLLTFGFDLGGTWEIGFVILPSPLPHPNTDQANKSHNHTSYDVPGQATLGFSHFSQGFLLDSFSRRFENSKQQ